MGENSGKHGCFASTGFSDAVLTIAPLIPQVRSFGPPKTARSMRYGCPSVYKPIALTASQQLAKREGLSAGLDVIFARVYVDSENFESKVTLRPWFAYNCGDGLGFRGRYWSYSGDVLTGGPLHLDQSVTDLDLTQTFTIGKSSLTGIVGATHRDFYSGGFGGYDFEAWGPAIGFQGARPIGRYLLAYYSPRFSVLYDIDSNEEGSLTLLQQSIGLQLGLPLTSQCLLASNIGCDTYNLYSAAGLNSDSFIGLTLGTGLIW